MRRLSPLSLRLIFETLKRAKDLTLKEVFQQDFQLIYAIFRRNDFYEGVDKLLISKTYDPKWEHEKVEDVTEVEIKECF